MEEYNVKIILFSEYIRKQMQANSPPLIKHRRRLLRTFNDVFVGAEAISWATNTLSVTSTKELDSNENNNSSDSLLNEEQACGLFQKLMDAGLLQNVTSQELFKNDKSYFRFSSDDVEAERLIRSVAIGFRIFDSAHRCNSKLFEKVCALGRLVSNECFKASQLLTWLVSSGLTASREVALALCQDMVDCNVLKPVDPEVKGFLDNKNFYLFAIDYRKPVLSVTQFLNSNFVPSYNVPYHHPTSNSSRNKLIHLRQSSDQLMDFSLLSLQTSNSRVECRKDSSRATECNGNTTQSAPSYQSLLNSDGTASKAALFHPSAPFVKKDILVYPDAVGYGFVVRGSGPCFVKIVDPDSPAGKAGLKAHQYITCINGNDVTDMPHTGIEDLILGGPKFLKMTVMQDKTNIILSPKPTENQPLPSTDSSSSARKRSSLPTAQPWIKNKTSSYNTGPKHPLVSR